MILDNLINNFYLLPKNIKKIIFFHMLKNIYKVIDNGILIV